MSDSVQASIHHIHSRMKKAAIGHDRALGDVTLIAVSKRQPDERIEAALSFGIRHFGENKVQEAYTRWEGRRGQYPDLTLHLVGPLQSNKAKDAVALFDMIHSVDREKIARVLSDEMGKQGRDIPCFVQVNTGEEPQKSGIAVGALDDFLQYCRGDLKLNIAGLMVLPPVDAPPALHFALLRKLARRHHLTQLSMGMSDDFEKAIALGATHIRVGSSIFGARAPV